MTRSRPWWPGAPRPLKRPRFRFLPTAYRPRQMPVRLVLAGAAAAALILGLGAVYTAVGDRMAAAHEQRHVAGVLDGRVHARAAELREAARAQAAIEGVSGDALEALQVANAVRGPGRGFAMALTEVTRHRVDGIVLREVDDDGTLVTVRATAAAHEPLLEYVRALETSGAFDSVAIRTIGGALPGARSPDPALFPSGESPEPSLTLELELVRSSAPGGSAPPGDETSGARVHVAGTAR